MTETSRGFTLIEMLAVLLIFGLFVGLVSAIARPDGHSILRVEAERLAQLLDLAAMESRLSGKFIAWTTDGPGYRFLRLNEDSGWSEIHDSDLLRARTMPQGVIISGLSVENMRPRGTMRLEFVPYDPTFAFTIEMAFGAERYAVAASPIGIVRVSPGEGKTNGEMALR